jgi:hypothetical protein
VAREVLRWLARSRFGDEGTSKSQIALVRPKLAVVASRRERGTVRSEGGGVAGKMRSVWVIVTSGRDMVEGYVAFQPLPWMWYSESTVSAGEEGIGRIP